MRDGIFVKHLRYFEVNIEHAHFRIDKKENTSQTAKKIKLKINSFRKYNVKSAGAKCNLLAPCSVEVLINQSIPGGFCILKLM